MPQNKITVFKSLSSQLLVLVIVFVLIVEILVFVPSISQFRQNYLTQRLVAAQIAALALEGAAGQVISPELEQELLTSADIQAVIVIRSDSRQLILRSQMPSSLVGNYDLRDPGFFQLIRDAFVTLWRGGEGSIQVQGSPINTRHQSVQIVMREAPLYNALSDYSINILTGSILISGLTGTLVFFLLMVFLVRPTRRITRNLVRFSRRPEDTDRTLKPSGLKNEIGLLETHICRMQEEIRQALKQKTNLANLGLAVSKINHDLKNILSTAQLSGDFLSPDQPEKIRQRTIKRLLNAVNRAINLCERTLKYGKADEAVPEKEKIKLESQVRDVQETLGKKAAEKYKWKIEIPKGFSVFADRDQFYRILFNLIHNATEAMKGGGTIHIRAKAVAGEGDVIWIRDTGPGIPEKARENLFVPFVGSTKGRGTGLGLAVTRELVEAHGGMIELEKTGPRGTVFRICFPFYKDRKNA